MLPRAAFSPYKLTLGKNRKSAALTTVFPAVFRNLVFIAFCNLTNFSKNYTKYLRCIFYLIHLFGWLNHVSFTEPCFLWVVYLNYILFFNRVIQHIDCIVLEYRFTSLIKRCSSLTRAFYSLLPFEANKDFSQLQVPARRKTQSISRNYDRLVWFFVCMSFYLLSTLQNNKIRAVWSYSSCRFYYWMRGEMERLARPKPPSIVGLI